MATAIAAAAKAPAAAEPIMVLRMLFPHLNNRHGLGRSGFLTPASSTTKGPDITTSLVWCEGSAQGFHHEVNLISPLV
jgi:hypothetical protein